ncbi:stage V sporulation protein B [Ruminiclostridium sufflavum DSM 19573]|uniref:Multidrug-efflux transporter n=1 Tax=Ruminiclostridium sufflavum DSM 19573 TaxID=1121337 RepID=A0A318XPN7_9FIRM|nr:stage V sporulation protein B [Ruminiclostridium sufflavum]PYG90326.1 stage V sporulation protein B [Ruminiclostridium sufflavum DSM 19573]
MNSDKFYKNSAILTLSNFITGFIGFAFSIVLSKKLGAEGLGLYGLIMPVYSLLICLTADGLITAVSKTCALYNSKKDYRNLNRTVKIAFIFMGLWSISVAVLVFINASNISTFFIKDIRAANALKIICPALVFIPFSAIFKGVFYGFEKFTIPAGIDILEKCIRITILLATMSLLTLNNVKGAVTAAYLALSIGEAISLIMLLLSYKIFFKRLVPIKTKVKNPLQLLVDILVISSPLCLNGFLSSILNTASTLILPRRLIAAGMSYDNALALIGKFIGMSLTTVNLPFIIVGSMMTVLIPDMSLSISKKDLWSTERRIYQVLKISFLVGLATLLVSLCIPQKLGILFYSRDDLGTMIKAAGICSFMSYASSATFGILNALGKQNVNLRNSIIVSVEGLICVAILTGIPSLNIYGYGISIILTSVTGLLINLFEIRKLCEIKFSFKSFFVFIMIGLIGYMTIKISSTIIPDSLIVFNVCISTIICFISIFYLSRFYNRISNS